MHTPKKAHFSPRARRGAFAVPTVLAVLILACQSGPEPRGDAAEVPASPPERPYRAAAIAAASWLRSVSTETEKGLLWPVDPDEKSEVADHLYHGNAGVVLFFAELARRTEDPNYLEDARRGADRLMLSLPESLEPYEAGLYTGVAGVGFALSRVGEVSGDARYREGVRQVVELLHESAKTVGDGVEWHPVTDIISGAAGTGLFLLYAGRTLDDPASIELAAAAGRRLLELSEEAPGGVRWQMAPDIPRVMPNFSHGTAGVAYFLASLYLETRDPAFLEAALAGAGHLLEIADTTEISCKIHHHTPDGEDLFYLGWCHGPAGTGRLFYRLYQATGDEAWLAWLRKAADSIVESDVPEVRTPGFWNNVGQCCGSAGVAEFLLAVDRVSGEARYRPLVRKLADDVLARATRTEAGLKWIQAEHRVEPELLVAQTGFMQGAAGVGMLLLNLDAAESGAESTAVFPDSPFEL